MINRTLSGIVLVLTMIYLIKLFFFIFFFAYPSNANIIEKNKILFKLNENAFTNYDLEKRIKYLEILNNNKINNHEINKEEILNDYISSLIFYEYFLYNELNFKNLQNNQKDFYQKIINNNKVYVNLSNEDIKSIKENILIDLVRKKILENKLNSQKNLLNKKTNTLDLIYNYNLNYLVLENKEKYLTKIKNIKNRSDFLEFIEFLEFNKIKFLLKNEDINDFSKVSLNIKNKINNKQNIDLNIEDSFIEIISIEKNLESYEGIFVKLFNYRTTKKLDKKSLNCNYLNQINDKIEFNEYEYTKLNKKIKTNLKSVNDYILIENNNYFDYIFLCELRYDEKILNSINFNKKVNLLAEEFENKILKEYKSKFNFARFDD